MEHVSDERRQAQYRTCGLVPLHSHIVFAGHHDSGGNLESCTFKLIGWVQVASPFLLTVRPGMSAKVPLTWNIFHLVLHLLICPD